MQAVKKGLMDMLVRELKEELEARDQRSAQDRQQGVAAPEAGGCTARSCARILQSETESHTLERMYTYIEWTTFTVM
jgi:hypothetical protein